MAEKLVGTLRCVTEHMFATYESVVHYISVGSIILVVARHRQYRAKHIAIFFEGKVYTTTVAMVRNRSEVV